VKGGEALLQLYADMIGKGRDKFLGFFEGSDLKLMEELLAADLGVKSRKRTGKSPRQRRPFIGHPEGEIVVVFFLTSQRTKYRVDLSLCYKVFAGCDWIRNEGYLLEDPERGYVAYAVRSILLEDRYTLCGRCEDLEFLENLEVREI